MNFFKAATMTAPLLKIPAPLWMQLIRHLRIQGADVRESGAFLLGKKTDDGRVVTQFLPYENLQPDALHNDYVSLTSTSFAKLWATCRAYDLSVVADIHTHRLGPEQSRSDKTNPMIALSGHIAFIVPRFAQGMIGLKDLGMYIYQGNHAWIAHSGSAVSRYVLITEIGAQR